MYDFGSEELLSFFEEWAKKCNRNNDLPIEEMLTTLGSTLEFYKLMRSSIEAQDSYTFRKAFYFLPEALQRAVVEITDSQGENLLFKAARTHNYALVSWVLMCKFDLSLKNTEGLAVEDVTYDQDIKDEITKRKRKERD